jgi:hypothetical protein
VESQWLKNDNLSFKRGFSSSASRRAACAVRLRV